MADTLRKEMKENERRALEGKSLKEKLSYIFYYYKWHMLGVIILLFIIGSFIKSMSEYREPYLQIAIVNADQTADFDSPIREYELTTDIDKDKEEMRYDSSYVFMTGNGSNGFDAQQVQKLFAATSAGMLDIIVCDEKSYEWISQMGYFRDLSDVFTAEELASYGDRIRKAEVESDLDGTIASEYAAIDVTDSPKLKAWGWYPEGKIYVGLVMESEHIDRALDFIRYLDK